jgi:hypothetical protein
VKTLSMISCCKGDLVKKLNPFSTVEGGSIFTLTTFVVLEQNLSVTYIATAFFIAMVANVIIIHDRDIREVLLQKGHNVSAFTNCKKISKQNRCLNTVLVLNLSVACLGIVHFIIPIINDRSIF